MSLAIDATNTPAIVSNTVGTVLTVTTASFTQPDGAVLLARWAGNSALSVAPSTPTITDSLGVHLTWTLVDWQSHADAPFRDSQSAIWVAVVNSGAAMTVTATNGANSSGLDGQSTLGVTVLTGADTDHPVGAHGKGGSSSASSVAASYTAQQTNSRGFIAVCDYDAKGTQTAGTGCTAAGAGNGSGTNSTALSYGFMARTTADGVLGASTGLNVALPGTSLNLSWVYVEIREAAPGGGGTPSDDPSWPWVWAV